MPLTSLGKDEVRTSMLQMMSLWHPELIVMIGLIFFLYLYADRHVGKSAEQQATTKQKVMFAAYLIVLYGAMGSPIDAVAQNRSFSVFVLQMVLMTLVLPWLFLTGIPTWMARAVLQIRWIFRTVRVLTSPFVALIVYYGLASLFLLPVIFEANLKYNWLHIVDAWVLMAAAVFLWWPLLSPAPEIPRLSRGFQLGYILFGTNFMMPIPVLLAISQHLWYNSYNGIAPFHRLLANQQLGAVLMVVAMIVVYGFRAVLTFASYDGSSWYE